MEYAVVSAWQWGPVIESPLAYVLSSTFLLVATRLLSTTIWLCFTRQVQRPLRIIRALVLLVLAFGLAVYAPDLLAGLFPAVIALFYFAAIVPTVYAIAGAWSPVGWAGFLACLAGSVGLGILVPLHTISNDLKTAFVVKGFEFAFASYSYVKESRKLGSRDLRECFFFLLVNPVLVFHQFGKRSGPPALSLRHVARFGLGLLTLGVYFGCDIVLQYLPFSVETMRISRVHSLDDYGLFLASTASVAVTTYLAHSGTASVQLSVMRLAGYVVPERYNYAFLATNPADWWRRWNTYVSSWFASYCLMPTMVFMRRHTRMHSLAAAALAVLICFVFSGLVHAAIATSVSQATVMVLCFAAEAVFVVTWLGASALGAKVADRLPAELRAPAVRTASFVSWALRVQVHLVILSFLFPLLTGGAESH